MYSRDTGRGNSREGGGGPAPSAEVPGRVLDLGETTLRGLFSSLRKRIQGAEALSNNFLFHFGPLRVFIRNCWFSSHASAAQVSSSEESEEESEEEYSGGFVPTRAASEDGREAPPAGIALPPAVTRVSTLFMGELQINNEAAN